MFENQIDLLTISGSTLQQLLSNATLSSESLVALCLDRISTFDPLLHSFISLAPHADLRARARVLDAERASGHVRGPLHGVPIAIKDNIGTIQGGASCGSLALRAAQTKRDAAVVTKLLDAGMIVLGKTSLSEMCFRGDGISCGWNAVTGQTQSAYVLCASDAPGRGSLGYQEHQGIAAHSNPGGSSSGSAVAVSAGLVPLALGTETEGSLVMPSARAALYTLKPTPSSAANKANLEGVVPLCPLMDTVGPMTKTVRDLALLLDIILPEGSSPNNTFEACLNEPNGGWWSDISLVALSPTSWGFPAVICESSPAVDAQLTSDIEAAYAKLASLAKACTQSAWVLPDDHLQHEPDKGVVDAIWEATFRDAFNAYLGSLEDSPVQTLAQLIEFNNNHAEHELPPGKESQSFLIASQNSSASLANIEEITAFAIQKAGAQGIDKLLEDAQADVVIGPADSSLTELAAAANYPTATLPLGYLQQAHGRPHGLVAVAQAGQERLLVRTMAAWEATFPARIPPNMSALQH